MSGTQGYNRIGAPSFFPSLPCRTWQTRKLRTPQGTGPVGTWTAPSPAGVSPEEGRPPSCPWGAWILVSGCPDSVYREVPLAPLEEKGRLCSAQVSHHPAPPVTAFRAQVTAPLAAARDRGPALAPARPPPGPAGFRPEGGPFLLAQSGAHHDPPLCLRAPAPRPQPHRVSRAP